MPSPFPGMDPYLEDPAVWADFHGRFADVLSVVLNGLLPPRYYAKLEVRPEVGIIDDDAGRPIVLDVSIQLSRRRTGPTTATSPETGGVATAEPRTEPSTSLRVKYAGESIRHLYVEIRDPTKGHSLITLIEIVSPSNKRPGKDRKAYRKKQKEVLESDANLVEIDLHSGGEPVTASPAPGAVWRGSATAARYVVCVSRAWERGSEEEPPEFEVYPFGLTDPLPCVLIPLREGEKEIPVDLQFVFHRVYDGGPYLRGAVEYDEPPPVKLSDEEKGWVRDRIAAAFPASPEAAP